MGQTNNALAVLQAVLQAAVGVSTHYLGLKVGLTVGFKWLRLSGATSRSSTSRRHMPGRCAWYMFTHAVTRCSKYFYFVSSLLLRTILPDIKYRHCRRHRCCSNQKRNDLQTTLDESPSSWPSPNIATPHPDRPAFDTAPRDAYQPQSVRSTWPSCQKKVETLS